MKSSLKFKDYVVHNIEFRNNIEFTNKEVKLDFDIDSEIDFVNENEFMLGLQLELFRDAEENDYPFNFKIEIIGMFEIEADTEQERMNYAEKNAVAILFPYVRALITTFTSASNVQPIILPPINVVSYLNNKRANKLEEHE